MITARLNPRNLCQCGIGDFFCNGALGVEVQDTIGAHRFLPGDCGMRFRRVDKELRISRKVIPSRLNRRQCACKSAIAALPVLMIPVEDPGNLETIACGVISIVTVAKLLRPGWLCLLFRPARHRNNRSLTEMLPSFSACTESESAKGDAEQSERCRFRQTLRQVVRSQQRIGKAKTTAQ